MGKIVVAKLYRLGKDGDKFSKEYKKPIRNRVVVDEDFVRKFNQNTKISGQMYEIDQAATSRRDEEIAAKSKGAKGSNIGDKEAERIKELEGMEFEDLKAYAIDLEITEEEIGNKKSKGIINLILEKQK